MLGLVLSEQTITIKRPDACRAERVSAGETEQEHCRARAAHAEERVHDARHRAGEQPRHIALHEQRREHEERKERRQHRLQAQRHTLPRRRRAHVGEKEQRRAEKYRKKQRRRAAQSCHSLAPFRKSV